MKLYRHSIEIVVISEEPRHPAIEQDIQSLVSNADAICVKSSRTTTIGPIEVPGMPLNESGSAYTRWETKFIEPLLGGDN